MKKFINLDRVIQYCEKKEPKTIEEKSITFLGVITECSDIPPMYSCSEDQGYACDKLLYCDVDLDNGDGICSYIRMVNTKKISCPPCTAQCDIKNISQLIEECTTSSNGTIVEKIYEIKYELFRPPRICKDRPKYPETNCYSYMPVLADSCWATQVGTEDNTGWHPNEPNPEEGYKHEQTFIKLQSCSLDSDENCKCPGCAKCEDYSKKCDCEYWKYATNPYLSMVFPNDCGDTITICPSIDPKDFKQITLEDAGECKDVSYDIVSEDYCCSSKFQDSLKDCRVLDGEPTEKDVIDTKCKNTNPCETSIKLPSIKAQKCRSKDNYCYNKLSLHKVETRYYEYDRTDILQDKWYGLVCDSCSPNDMNICLDNELSRCPKNTEKNIIVQVNKYVEEEVLESFSVTITAYFCVKN